MCCEVEILAIPETTETQRKRNRENERKHFLFNFWLQLLPINAFFLSQYTCRIKLQIYDNYLSRSRTCLWN